MIIQMKITARVSFEKPANREFVIRAFFSEAEFSRSNSIKIEDDKTAVIELVFSNIPPQSIIKAISNCKIESLEYKDDTSEIQHILSEKDVTGIENAMSIDEGKTEKLQPLDDYDVGMPDGISQCDEERSDNQITSTENSDKTYKSKHRKRRGRAKPSEEDYLDIPDLDELARESESFNEFVLKVSKWLDIDKDLEEYFCNLMRELKKLEQKPYELRMIQIENITKEVTRKPCQKTKLSKYLTYFFTKKKIDGGTFTPFIITVLKYKDAFSNEKKNEDKEGNENETKNTAEIPATEEAESAKAADVTSESLYAEDTESDSTKTSKAIMPPPLRGFEERHAEHPVIPEKTNEFAETPNKSEENNNLISNPAFAEIFSKVDKSLPIREQISFLYSEMGFNKSSKSVFEKLCELTMNAISMNELDSIDDVMTKAGIDASTTNGLRAKVKISDMINDYNKANHIKRMKVIAFLREIKSIFSLE